MYLSDDRSMSISPCWYIWNIWNIISWSAHSRKDHKNLRVRVPQLYCCMERFFKSAFTCHWLQVDDNQSKNNIWVNCRFFLRVCRSYSTYFTSVNPHFEQSYTSISFFKFNLTDVVPWKNIDLFFQPVQTQLLKLKIIHLIF